MKIFTDIATLFNNTADDRHTVTVQYAFNSIKTLELLVMKHEAQYIIALIDKEQTAVQNQPGMLRLYSINQTIAILGLPADTPVSNNAPFLGPFDTDTANRIVSLTQDHAAILHYQESIAQKAALLDSTFKKKPETPPSPSVG